MMPYGIAYSTESVSRKVDSVDVQPFSTYLSITGRNIFNTQEPSDWQRMPSDIEQLHQTRLKLKLWGTVTGPENRTYAVIEDPFTKSQHLIKVGDTLQGASVATILKGKIVLQVNAGQELLEMERWSSQTTDRASSAFSAPVGPPRHAVTVKRSQIDDALKDISQLTKQIQFSPSLNEGSPDGLLISGIQPSSFFNQVGLMSGDILSGVNGTPIKSLDDALKLYSTIKSASHVSFQMKRGGQEETIEYTIE